MIDLLNWDSAFFGFKTGRYQCLDHSELADLVPFAMQAGYQLLYLFSKTPIDTLAVSHGRLLDVGGQLTYCKQLQPSARLAQPMAIESLVVPYTAKQPNERLLELAFLSGHLSRFRVDPWLPKGSFEGLYKRWLQNNLEDEKTSRVYIVGPEPKPLGLLTASWRIGYGTIDLLAVHSEAQGQGIGSQLLAYVENDALSNGLDRILVKTQMINEKAKQAYARNQYSSTEELYVYHLHL